MRRVGLLSAIGLALTSAPLPAQTDTSRVVISGVVIDPLGHSIEGVEIRAVGTEVSGMSSAEGAFRLVVPRPSSRTILLQIRRPGYNPQFLSVAGNWSGTIRLTPGALKLPEVTVNARYAKPAKYAATSKYDDVFLRRRMGLGELIDRNQIDRRGAQETAQILEGRPGIRVRILHSEMTGDFGGTLISFSRCSEFPPKINVYVDGKKLQPRLSIGTAAEGESILGFMARQPDQKELDRRRQIRMIVGEMLERVNPSDIEMIEIFRGPSDLPPEFNDGNCGAIAIWTRQGGQESNITPP